VVTLDALTFLVMGIVLFSIPDIPRTKREEHLTGGWKIPGFARLMSMKVVFTLSILTLFMLFAQGFQSVTFSLYSQKTLAAGASGYGCCFPPLG